MKLPHRGTLKYRQWWRCVGTAPSRSLHGDAQLTGLVSVQESLPILDPGFDYVVFGMHGSHEVGGIVEWFRIASIDSGEGE